MMERLINLPIYALATAVVFLLSIQSPSFAEEEIRIGAVYSLSGWAAQGGSAELRGAEMALDKINAAGGVSGKKIKLIAEDNRSDLKSTVSAIKKLAQIDKVPVILGPNWAEFFEVAAPVADQEKVVLLAASGYKEEIAEKDDYIFSTLPSYAAFTKPLAEKIIAGAPQRLAFLTSEAAYTQNIARALKRQLESAGLQPSMEIDFAPEEQDYRSIVAKLKAKKVDALVTLLLEGGAFASFIRQLRDSGFTPQIYAGNTLPYDEVLKKDLSPAEGVIFYDVETIATQEFKADFLKRYAEEPTYASSRAYDNLFLVKDALQRCGKGAEEVKKCLLSADYAGISGRIRFSAGGAITGFEQPSHLMTVRLGRFERLG